MFEVQIGSPNLRCCNCLPEKFLKISLFIGIILIFVFCSIIEIGALIFKGRINNNDELSYDQQVRKSTLSFMTFFQIFGIIITIVAIFGLLGIRNKTNCFIGIFNTGNCCFFFIFALIFAITKFYSAFSSLSKEYKCNLQISEENDILYKAAAENLCKEGCECYFSGTITKDLQKYIQSYSTTDNTLPVRFEQCPQSQQYNESKINSLKLMESSYQCSGWCTQYPIQYFNNVNQKLNTKQNIYIIIYDLHAPKLHQIIGINIMALQKLLPKYQHFSFY